MDSPVTDSPLSGPPIRAIGVCTGGGDCPGLNAVIRGVVRAGIRKGWRVFGVQDGFDGLIWPARTREMNAESVSGILPRGGTILGTTNRGNPFAYQRDEDGKTVVHDYSDQVIANARILGIDALVVVGGDGTLKIALDLYRKGLALVGVPKTIDNDLSATESTFGFDTAIATATDAIDKLHTTAESHHRVMVVEVMGRDAGWIALHAGLAGGAHAILIPEIPIHIEKVKAKVREREREGSLFSIVVVAEGCREIDGRPIESVDRERRRCPQTGIVGHAVAEAIAAATRRETRVTVLGHLQRGGGPTAFDRILSSRFGVGAVELIARGQFGRMVCLQAGDIGSAPLEEAVGTIKRVKPGDGLVRTAKALGIVFGD